MKQPPLRLNTKRILSYVGVALGTTVRLVIAIALVVQQFIYKIQYSDIQKTLTYRQLSSEHYYKTHNNSWDGFAGPLGQGQFFFGQDQFFMIVVDNTGKVLSCSPATFQFENGGPVYIYGDCPPNDSTTSDAIIKALHGQATQGEIQTFMEPQDGDRAPPPHSKHGNVSLLYISTPLQNNNQTIGAIFLAEPKPFQSPLPGPLIDEVTQAILIVGIAVALVVFLSSLLLARHFTQPLKALTRAAEQMKRGKYTQRVAAPKTQDELGELALTFNEMADTIEADVNELRRQDQMRRDLVANIAHDLATPLTSIQGFSEALADDVISDRGARHETAQRIAREVQRLRRLVADIQQMSSLEAGTARLDLAPLDLHTLVDETLFVIEPECKQKDITVRNDIPPNAPLVLADSDRITQVLLNLIDNARRHTSEGGKISVGALPQHNSLYVWVIDTGCGIKKEDLPHIFERFYRADRARSGNTGGSGLGLSIVKAIITAHGGNIWAESAPDRGTRITFSLPITTQTSPRIEDASDITAPRKPLPRTTSRAQ